MIGAVFGRCTDACVLGKWRCAVIFVFPVGLMGGGGGGVACLSVSVFSSPQLA